MLEQNRHTGSGTLLWPLPPVLSAAVYSSHCCHHQIHAEVTREQPGRGGLTDPLLSVPSATPVGTHVAHMCAQPDVGELRLHGVNLTVEDETSEKMLPSSFPQTEKFWGESHVVLGFLSSLSLGFPGVTNMRTPFLPSLFLSPVLRSWDHGPKSNTLHPSHCLRLCFQEDSRLRYWLIACS